MASIHQDPRTRVWQIVFRWEGEQYKRTAQTKKKKDAETLAGRVEDTIRMLRTGHLAMPEEADPPSWILSNGQQAQQRSKNGKTRSESFGKVCDLYFEDQKEKAESTLSGEKIHIAHLKRILRESRAMTQIDIALMQGYVNKRLAEKWRKKPISGRTIHKELVTFRQIWKWARFRGHAKGSCPIIDEQGKRIVSVPKQEEKERFQTWQQITRRINRESLNSDQVPHLWGSLFLDEQQVADLLEHVRKYAAQPFIYPMYAFAAYTGVRRSEIIRSQVDDFDFEQRLVRIREKKRKKDMASSTRFVPLNQHLVSIMQKWFDEHPGGKYTISVEQGIGLVVPKPLNPDLAQYAFKNPLKNSKWSVVRGFHVLRHSFGANLARSGRLSSEVIGKWMGHSTDDMRDLYQHLFPQDGPMLIDVLGYGEKQSA